MGRQSRDEGWVYIVGAEGTGMVKIGFTNQPPQRFKALRADSAVPLIVLYLDVGGVAEEKALHRRFADLRVRGEWFRFERGSALDAFVRDARCDPFLPFHCDDFNEEDEEAA
jgi:hypothetical protein